MTGLPLQGTAEQREARSLPNTHLAMRLGHIRSKRRAYSKDLTDAYLEEAERRLRWSDAYLAGQVAP